MKNKLVTVQFYFYKSSKLFVFCLLVLTSCLKDKLKVTTSQPTLPPITNEGKNTFGCYVNGKLWLPLGYDGYARSEYYPWSIASQTIPEVYGNLRLVTFNREDKSGFSIKIQKVFEKGKNMVYTSSDLKSYLLFVSNQSTYYNYVEDTSNLLVISRLDTIDKIVSGTFQFKLINELNKLDTLKVTDGRFDLRYSY